MTSPPTSPTPRTLEGELTVPAGLRVAVVAPRFNDFIVQHLIDGALDTFTRHGGNAGDVTVARVPGSVELPLLARKLAQSGDYASVVCLGCVIRGDTGHYDMVVMQAAKGISEVGLSTGVPCIFGVLTCDSLEQAIDRAGAKAGNSGAKAMLSAIEMANLLAKL